MRTLLNLNLQSNSPLDLQGNGDIRIIGDRGAGKTTFMAALAYWPNGNPESSPIQSIDPFAPDTGILIEMAQNILENGQTLPPTRPGQPPLYSFIVQLKPSFWKNPREAVVGRNLRLQVSCREYAGELVDQLRSNLDDPILSTYLDDCATATGLLLLVDATSTYDREFAQALTNLERELNLRLTHSNRNKRQYRIALMFSKAEQPQVWNYQNEIPNFVKLKFPKTQQALQNWRRVWGCQVSTFFSSAFGMMGNPPQPNVRVIQNDGRGTSAVIARPKFWKPFGLVAPIYWLHTGQSDERLQQI
ncbi:MAG: hypothetical protein V7L13_07425 [Nostoc sp.]|uniref:hypothetical protein n=1 Tax=unclassified Nostoc TaxID=2593658 RepID=UPI002FF4B915